MNNKHFTIIICFATILMAACAPSPQAIQTAIAQTQAANPTFQVA
jgi:starvation-inducible outer membrane lipoprotein